MQWQFTFLSPAWLGLALVATIVVLMTLPRLSQWRALPVLIGCGVASLAALIGLVPWIGQLHVTGYSIMMLAAFVVAWLVTVKRAPIIGLHERGLLDIAAIGLIGGIIGSRIGEMWEQGASFFHSANGEPLPFSSVLSKVMDFDSGGMVWYGGAILGGVGILIYAHKQRVGMLQVSDLLMPAVLLGLGVGRIGCFLNGCCFGRPTDLPWAVTNSHGHIHPTQLYETIACSAMAGLLWWRWLYRRWQGEILTLGLLGYAIWRFINEGLRGDTIPSSFFGLWTVTTSQAISLYLVLLVLVLAAIELWRRFRDPERARLARVVPGSKYDQRRSEGDEKAVGGPS